MLQTSVGRLVGVTTIEITPLGSVEETTGEADVGRNMTIVPVWPTTVGTAAVEVTTAVIPETVLVMVVYGAGICTTTVPVWPTTVGMAPVDVIGAVAPAAGLREVMVVKVGGISTNTVPVWPTTVGVGPLEVTVVVSAGIMVVIVVKAGGISINTVPV